MKDDKLKMEQRLDNMKRFYLEAGELIDNLPEAIPKKTRAVAAGGTSAIGNAAIAYYIENKTLEEAKKKFDELKNANKK